MHTTEKVGTAGFTPNPLHVGPVPMRKRTQAVGGLGARDQRDSSWQQAVKRHDCVSHTVDGRKRTTGKLPINVKNRVGITGGFVAGADASRERVRQTPETRVVVKRAARKAARARGGRSGILAVAGL